MTLAIVDGYPAFQPDAGKGTPHKIIPLRAVIYLKPSWDKDRNIIVINPAHLTPETVHAALRLMHIRTTRPPATGPRDYAILTATHTLRPVSPEVAAELSAKIQELRDRPVSGVSNFGPGREVMLGDISQYLAPAK